MQQCEIHGFASYLGVRVDCFMTRGYLTGKSLRIPVLGYPTIVLCGAYPDCFQAISKL